MSLSEAVVVDQPLCKRPDAALMQSGRNPSSGHCHHVIGGWGPVGNVAAGQIFRTAGPANRTYPFGLSPVEQLKAAEASLFRTGPERDAKALAGANTFSRAEESHRADRISAKRKGMASLLVIGSR
jgi:hypothetical protein